MSKIHCSIGPDRHAGTYRETVAVFSGLYLDKSTTSRLLKTGSPLVKELIVIIPLLRNFKSEIV